jgi:hypothetical protein
MNKKFGCIKGLAKNSINFSVRGEFTNMKRIKYSVQLVNLMESVSRLTLVSIS